MDLHILAFLNGLAGRAPASDAALIFCSETLPYLLALPLLALLLGVGPGNRDPRGALVAIAAVGLALLAARQLGHWTQSPRPFVTEPWVIRLVAHKADSGMPSSHAAAVFAAAVAVALRHRRLGTLMLMMATLAALGRAAIGLHWPSQILVGAVLGGSAAGLVHGLALVLQRAHGRAIETRTAGPPAGRGRGLAPTAATRIHLSGAERHPPAAQAAPPSRNGGTWDETTAHHSRVESSEAPADRRG